MSLQPVGYNPTHNSTQGTANAQQTQAVLAPVSAALNNGPSGHQFKTLVNNVQTNQVNPQVAFGAAVALLGVTGAVSVFDGAEKGPSIQNAVKKLAEEAGKNIAEEARKAEEKAEREKREREKQKYNAQLPGSSPFAQQAAEITQGSHPMTTVPFEGVRADKQHKSASADPTKGGKASLASQAFGPNKDDDRIT